VVERARPEDLEDVAGLVAGFRDWFGKDQPTLDGIRASLAALLDDEATEFLLARDAQGRAMGFCQLRYRLSVWTGTPDCWLEDLFVDEAARRAGVGRSLVEAAFAGARARGCRRIELDVNEDNAAALAFYETLGFTTEPKPPGRTLFVGRRL
jgi:ribosomal protein S18 acetylase RimI-like enzyme